MSELGRVPGEQSNDGFISLMGGHRQRPSGEETHPAWQQLGASGGEEIVDVLLDADAEGAVWGIDGPVTMEGGARPRKPVSQDPKEDLHFLQGEAHPVNLCHGGRRLHPHRAL